MPRATDGGGLALVPHLEVLIDLVAAELGGA